MYDQFLKILENQKPEDDRKEVWTPIKYKLEETEKDKLVKITSHSVTFFFDKVTGLLKGISKDKV